MACISIFSSDQVSENLTLNLFFIFFNLSSYVILAKEYQNEMEKVELKKIKLKSQIQQFPNGLNCKMNA